MTLTVALRQRPSSSKNVAPSIPTNSFNPTAAPTLESSASFFSRSSSSSSPFSSSSLSSSDSSSSSSSSSGPSLTNCFGVHFLHRLRLRSNQKLPRVLVTPSSPLPVTPSSPLPVNPAFNFLPAATETLNALSKSLPALHNLPGSNGIQATKSRRETLWL